MNFKEQFKKFKENIVKVNRNIGIYRKRNSKNHELVINNEVLKQINHFNYFRCDISYNFRKVVEQKIKKFSYISGPTNNALENETREDTTIIVNTLVVVGANSNEWQ